MGAFGSTARPRPAPPSASSAPMLRSSIHAALLALATSALLACGDPVADAIRSAELHLAYGQLERASAAVAGVQGPAVERLRERIEGVRRTRAEVQRRALELAEKAPTTPQSEMLGELKALSDAQTDPVAEEVVDAILSQVYDYYSARSASWKPEPVLAEPDVDPHRPNAYVPASEAALARSADPAGEDPAQHQDEDGEGAAGACEVEVDLDVEVELASAAEPAEAAAAQTEGEPAAPRPITAIGWEERALELAAENDLAGARAAWLEAGTMYGSGPLREEALGYARDLADRLALRSEIADAFALDPSELQRARRTLRAVDAEGLELGGARVAWSEVELKDLLALAHRVRLSANAELGLVSERLARGDENGAWGALEKLLGSERVEEPSAWGLIARWRGETPPDGGYVVWEGVWVRPEQIETLEIERTLAGAYAVLLEAQAGPELDAAYATLAEHQRYGRIAEGLELRWARVCAELAEHKTVNKLESLAHKRTELDARRAEALALIFDEEEYFYPYRPPECPPEKARLYPKVQQRVDALVERVREAWDVSQRVSVPRSFRAAVGEVLWVRARQDELDLEALALPAELPEWVLGLPADLDDVGVGEFAWNWEEGRDLAYSRAVRARNERLWTELDEEAFADGEPGRLAHGVEQQQVRITNDYRVMFGRRALAWNPRIQHAAYDHSEWMANTGNFGHFEPGRPETYGPNERMTRRGYDRGISENLAYFGGDPGAAHSGWCTSSGHHRNILMDGHREMASSTVGRFWTQNFGVATAFLDDLSGWHD